MSEHRGHSLSAVEMGEREIRDLVQEAGPRPAVPVADLAAIRDAAKEEWRETVRRERERSRFRRRSRVLALAASVLLAAAIGWWLMPEWRSVAPELVASVEVMRGEVFVDDGDLTLGSGLAAGAVLETGQESSGAAIRLRAGQSVRLDKDSRVRLASGSTLELERGAVYVDTFQAASEAGIEVSTPYGMVRDIGTQFEVRVGSRGSAELTVRVREGEIELERGAKSDSAKAGEQLTLHNGSIEPGHVKRHGAAWDWVQDVAPAMETDGAPIASYLEWVARETGRELRYADESLARSAQTEVMVGTFEVSTPEESLNIVMPSTGFGYRIENGLLLIERP